MYVLPKLTALLSNWVDLVSSSSKLAKLSQLAPCASGGSGSGIRAAGSCRKAGSALRGAVSSARGKGTSTYSRSKLAKLSRLAPCASGGSGSGIRAARSCRKAGSALRGAVSSAHGKGTSTYSCSKLAKLSQLAPCASGGSGSGIRAARSYNKRTATLSKSKAEIPNNYVHEFPCIHSRFLDVGPGSWLNGLRQGGGVPFARPCEEARHLRRLQITTLTLGILSQRVLLHLLLEGSPHLRLLVPAPLLVIWPGEAAQAGVASLLKATLTRGILSQRVLLHLLLEGSPHLRLLLPVPVLHSRGGARPRGLLRTALLEALLIQPRARRGPAERGN